MTQPSNRACDLRGRCRVIDAERFSHRLLILSLQLPNIATIVTPLFAHA
jgi:hypothetical protein